MKKITTIVVICWKIRIFAYWTTPIAVCYQSFFRCDLLKNSYLCLLNNTITTSRDLRRQVVICWKIRIFAYWTTPGQVIMMQHQRLWFAEKFVSLLIEQHQVICVSRTSLVVICWKIRIFAYWTTPNDIWYNVFWQLWFAEKFVSLLIEQHLKGRVGNVVYSCDLLKNSYLCLLNNTNTSWNVATKSVVICWKIRIFAYWTTPNARCHHHVDGCDLLKNSYLCLLNNTPSPPT